MRLTPTLRAALCSSTAIVALWAFPASAQQQPLPPENYTLDERGVDLVSGTFNYAVTEVAVGDPSDGGLAHTRIYTNGGWRDDTAGTMNISGSTYTVSIGGESEIFIRSGSIFTPQTRRGFTLTESGGTYTFTTGSGAVGTFSGTYADANSGYVANGGYLTTLAAPNGAITSYNYATPQRCAEFDTVTTDCIRYETALRLQSVTNNRGYMIHYEYAGDDPEGLSLGSYLTRTAATAINNAIDYCDPLASVCTPQSRIWPRVTYDQFVPTQVTDEAGRVTTYSYGVGGLTGIRLPGQTSDQIAITYHGSGKVASVTDAGGTWTYTYSDVPGIRTTTSSGPLSQQRTIVSDLTIGRATAVTDRLDGTTSYTTSYQYDSQRRLQRITRPEGDYTQISYDDAYATPRGNVVEVRNVAKPSTGLADIVTLANYPANCTDPGISIRNCNRPLQTRDANGAYTDYVWSASHGGLEIVTAPAPTVGAVRPQQRYSYTPLSAYYKVSSNIITASPTAITLPTSISACNNFTTCAGGADETLTTIAYGSTGVANNLQPTQTTVAAGNGSISSSVAMTYDPNGDLVTMDGPIAGTGDTSVYFYNSSRWPLGAIGPDPDGGGPLLNRATRLTYNDDGTVAQSELGTANGQSLPSWTAFSTLQQQVTAYDAYLRPTATRFNAGGTTYSLVQTRYDAAGRTDCVAQRMNSALFGSPPSDACALGTQGSFGPDRIVQVGYDALSRPVTVTSGLGTGDALTESGNYTANGLPLSLVDGNNNRSTMVYDGFDRLRRLEYPSATTGSGVSNPADYQEYGYDPNGNVTTYRTRNNQLFTTTFDALNRPTGIVQTGSVVNVGSQAFTYDLFNRPLNASIAAVPAASPPPAYTPYAPASTVTMTWDALGRQLTETNFRDLASLGTSTMTYDSAGRRTSLQWPDTFTTTYEYDATNALSRILQSGSPYVTYSYDNLGRRAGIARPNGVNTTYGYDGGSRLTSLAHAFSAGTGSVTFTYVHNPAGQVVSVTPNTSTYDFPQPATSTNEYAVNGLNQTGIDNTFPYDQIYSHDIKGNMLTDGTRIYTYDQANRLRSSAVGGTVNSTLSYDALGRLGELTGTQGARYVYDGAEISGIINNGSTSLINRIVRGPWPDEVVVSYPTSGTPLWLLQDHLGSTIAITDQSGNLITALAYDEYGVPKSGNSGRFQYTGQLWLPDAQVYHYKNRAYHPSLGRFVQPDPVDYAAGMNLYAYVLDDPINLIDPLGLTQECRAAPGEDCVDDIVVTPQPRQDRQITYLPPIFVIGGRGGGLAESGGGGGGGQGTPTEQERACSASAFEGIIGNPRFERQARRAMRQAVSTPNRGLGGDNPRQGSEYGFFAARYPFGLYISRTFTSRAERRLIPGVFSGSYPFASQVVLYHTHQSSSPGATGSLSIPDIRWSEGSRIAIIADNEDGRRYCYVP